MQRESSRWSWRANQTRVVVVAVVTAAVGVATVAVGVVSAAAVEVFRAAGPHRVEGFRTEAEVEVSAEAGVEASAVAEVSAAVNTAAGRLPRAEGSARAA